jgi:hypothetical protein
MIYVKKNYVRKKSEKNINMSGSDRNKTIWDMSGSKSEKGQQMGN